MSEAGRMPDTASNRDCASPRGSRACTSRATTTRSSERSRDSVAAMTETCACGEVSFRWTCASTTTTVAALGSSPSYACTQATQSRAKAWTCSSVHGSHSARFSASSGGSQDGGPENSSSTQGCGPAPVLLLRLELLRRLKQPLAPLAVLEELHHPRLVRSLDRVVRNLLATVVPAEPPSRGPGRARADRRTGWPCRKHDRTHPLGGAEWGNVTPIPETSPQGGLE